MKAGTTRSSGAIKAATAPLPSVAWLTRRMARSVVDHDRSRGRSRSICIVTFFCRAHFWPTVLSVEPLVHCFVCLSSSVCDVLYCGKTVRPSQKVSEGVNRKPGSKSPFFGRRHISTSGFAATATETAVFALFLPVQPSNWY